MDEQNYIGAYYDIFVASSGDRRLRSSATSGGVVTQVLLNHFDKGLIDAAVLVDMDNKKPWQPEVIIARSREDIIRAKGSKYVTILIKDFLEKVEMLEKEKKRYAVVGLPCHIRILHSLSKKGKLEGLVLKIGLFCGYNMPPEATYFVLRKLGIKKEDVAVLRYRAGKYPGGMLIRTKDGIEYFLPKHYYDFLNLMFLPAGCSRCKDYTSERADLSCGDAWGYDDKTVLIKRKSFDSSMIDKKKISFDDFFRMHKHNLVHKKKGDSFMMKITQSLLKSFGKYLPLGFLGSLAYARRKLRGK